MPSLEEEQPRTIGAYRILAELKRGAFGVIYRAKRPRRQQEVAIKTVARVEGPALESLRREIRALSRLNHPGVVSVFEQGLEDGVPWYSMELLDGPTLLDQFHKARTGAEGRLSMTRLRPALLGLRQVCAALAYVHGEGIVHGDLKPENVLQRSDETSVLVDFGLMHFAGAAGREALELAESRGTLAYMAPEQIRGETIDARADLYALGCILYELLTGRAPFATLSEVLDDSRQPPPPSAFTEGLPPELDEMTLELLRKDRRDRIGHADTVASILERLTGPEAPPGPPARSYLYRAGFAGRTRLLQAMVQYLRQQLGSGQGGVVLLGGESGIGKTRFALELGRALASDRVRAMAGECTAGASPQSRRSTPAPHGRPPWLAASGVPLEALRKPLQAVGDLCREAGLAETERLLGRRGKVLAAFEPSLAGLPGQQTHPEPPELPPKEARLRLYSDLAETFCAAAQGPTRDSSLLLILDDLQWADELTLGFLEFLVTSGRLEHTALVAVGLYRTEEAAEALRALLNDTRVRKLQLGRLEVDAVSDLIADMLALRPVPRLFVQHLARQSEGNPFFVTEYLRAAVEQGLLWRDATGRWQVGPRNEKPASLAQYENLPLPRSLQELIGRRLSDLGKTARLCAQAAAVLGRQMSLDLLHAVAGLTDSRKALDSIAELLRRQVLEQLETGEFRFLHDKLREVTYQSIPPRRRRALHRQAARHLETLPNREQRLALLGHHWEQAGLAARACGCYLPAARQATAAYSLNEAERLYKACLRLAAHPDVPDFQLRNELASTIYFVQGRALEARESHEAALAGALAVGDSTQQAEALRGLGILDQDAGDASRALCHYHEALDLQQRNADLKAQAQTLGNLGNFYRVQGRQEAAQEYMEQTLQIVRELGDRRIECYTLNNLAGVRHAQGRLDDSAALLEQALLLVRSFGDGRLESHFLSNLALLRHEQGFPAQASALWHQALDLKRQLGLSLMEGGTLSNMALLHQEQGDFQQARRLYEQAIDQHRQRGDQREVRLTLANLALLARLEGRLEEAEQLSRQALQLLREFGDRRNEGFALVNLAVLDRCLGRLEESRLHCQQTIDEMREIGDQRFLAQALYEAAATDRLANGVSQSEDPRLTEAQSLLDSAGYRSELIWCLCQQGHHLLALGKPCHDRLREAEQLAAALGLGPVTPAGRLIQGLREAAQALETGQTHRLFRGELIENLPPALCLSLTRAGLLPEAP